MIKYRILCHHGFEPNGQQYTAEFWAMPYDDEIESGYWGGASVVIADIPSLEEAEELAEKFQREHAALMEQHYKE